MSGYRVIGVDEVLSKVHGEHINSNGDTGWQVTADAAGESTAEQDLQWQERALCAQTDPEAFFPEKGGSVREAKKMCQLCEVKEPCLEFALNNDERFGIWGGLSERERRRLKRGVA